MLDEKLFDQFSRVGHGRRIFRDLLTPDAAVQESRFLAGEIQYPDLYYAIPDSKLLTSEIAELADMPGAVQAAKTAWPVEIADSLAELYDHAIATAIHERQMLLQGYSPERAYNAQAFGRAQKAFYGDMRSDLFWSSMQHLAHKSDISILQQDTSPAGRELIALFDHAKNEEAIALPDIHPHVRAVFAPLLKTDEIWDTIHPRPDGLVDVAEVFTAALDIYGVAGWQVVSDPHAQNLSVTKSAKKVVVSDAHGFMPAMKVLIKTIHEIGVHVRRSQAGSTVALYNAGLPGYYLFEEGFACVVANLPRHEMRVNGQRLYAALGLALGLDGTPRDFREVFELLWRMDMAHGHDITSARKTAYKQCRRLFRGAHPATKGNCTLRDKSYVEGIHATLNFFARTPMTSELASDLLTYRFTPTDTAQQKLITFIKQK